MEKNKIEIPELINGRHAKHLFGIYEGVKLESSWVSVKDDNMMSALRKLRTDTWKEEVLGTRPYFKAAEILAKKIMLGDELSENDMNAFKAICLISAGDSRLPNGAVVTAVFMHHIIETNKERERENKEKEEKNEKKEKDKQIPNRNEGKKPVVEKRFGNAIMSLHEEGKSIREIAKLLKLNKETVQKIIVRNKNSKTIQQ